MATSNATVEVANIGEILCPTIASHHAFHEKWESLQQSLQPVLELAHSKGWVECSTNYDTAIDKAIQRLHELKSHNIDYAPHVYTS